MNKATPLNRLLSSPHPAAAPGALRPSGLSAWLGVMLLCGLLGFTACGEIRPYPVAFEPQAYTPITYRDLLAPGPAGLQAGQKVRVQAYFWEYLHYDPAMVRNYLTLLRYPVRWYQLQWFSTYDTADLTGYYGLAAVTPEQAEKYKLNRLDPVMLYGELSRLGQEFYLQVFHIEKITQD